MSDTTIIQNHRVLLPRSLLASVGLDNGDVLAITQADDGSIVLRRAATADLASGSDDRGRPVPPTWMLQAVIGNSDPKAFAASGDKIAGYFADILNAAGYDVRRFQRALDFGCGCGRVIRSMPAFTDAQLFGCDLKPEFMDWCQQNLAFGRFVQGTEYPPLPYESDSFDFVYGVSVVTHMDEEHQDRWLDELKRILKPGGALLLTFKAGTGKPYGEIKSDEERAQIESNQGIHYIHSDHFKGIFPEYYQTAYHTFDYVRGHWGKFFEVVAIHPVIPGIWQDAALLRKPV